MNTPKTKARKRFKADYDLRAPAQMWPLPQSITIRLGCFLTEWGNVERAMEDVFRAIIRTPDASLVSRAIISASMRIELCRKILATSVAHMKTPESYDALLDEFERLNSLRNKLVHWQWHMRHSDQKIFIDESYATFGPNKQIEMDIEQLDIFLLDMQKFKWRVEEVLDPKFNRADFADQYLESYEAHLKRLPNP